MITAKQKYRFVIDNNFSLVHESYFLADWKRWFILRWTGWKRIEIVLPGPKQPPLGKEITR